MKRASFALVLAACNTPTPQIELAFSGSLSQTCPSTDCAMVPMSCQTVMSIRIVDPTDTTSPHLSQCVLVAPEHHNMCALAGVDLDSTPIPVRELEIQVALYPATVIPTDPMNSDVLFCPTNVEYSAATGFPVEQSPAPALGGHAFYHPGDQTVVVTLGCTDLAAINDSCVASNLVTVAATDDDFDTRVPVTAGTQGTADRLWVSAGEPHPLDSVFVLDSPDIRPLERSSDGPIPTWGGDIENVFNKYACLEVLEVAGQTTATLQCQTVTPGPRLDLSGTWMAKWQLDEILLALGLSSFPDEGLTVGMVVDGMGTPVVGATVSASAGTVQYLSAQRNGLTSGVTSNTGIFMSRDAMFGTVFSTGDASQPGMSGIGGLVAGKVTVVILQAGAPTP